MRFSLFCFSDDGTKTGENKYQLLLESAKYADAHGFHAIWTPERHFQDFGGLYPNPSVLSAALAMITRRLHLRAGSVALPLHNPIRVAEEWSLVDNLSNGRVGVSFASGWHPNDFVLSPSNYENRREIMFAQIEVIRRLWAGEPSLFKGGNGSDVEVRVFPRPRQARLPVWITSSGSRETWRRAGEIGANILTGVRGDPARELASRIAQYREDLARHGHDAEAAQVTVMLHTFIGEDLDKVRERVRNSLTGYLRTFVAQGDDLNLGELGVSGAKITEADKDALAAFAFERFFNTGLLGTPDKCAQLVESLREAGVDEIACLVDFGLDTGEVLDGLRHLNELKERFAAKDGVAP